LQRSELERSGKEAAADLRATEVLQRAEQESSTSRFAAVTPDAWTMPLAAETGVAVAESMRESVPAAVRKAAGAVAPPVERTDGPSQCEVLNVMPTAASHLVSVLDSESPAGEAFHLLGVRLRHMRRQRPLKKVLITSSIPQEGKSLVAANLACTLALRTQQKVLLLEGDVRRPTQSKIFGLPYKPGICEWLKGERSLVKSMYKLDRPGVWILPAGQATGESLDLLQSGRAIPMMEQLTDWFDWVVIDSPPILPLADTSVWINMADGILLVARQGITQKRQLKRGLEALGNQKMIGAVLNGARTIAHTDYYYRPPNRLPTDDAEG
jgi:capsular exopolysaccharide synthesis family protein